MNDNKGLTIIELLIAISIVSILTAVAASPRFLHYRSNYKVNVSAREIVNHLQNAKMTAVKENSSIPISFPSFSGVDVINNTISGSFSKRGIPDSGGGSLQVTNGSRTLTVILTAAGATRIN